jgi:hypothetical protein
VVIKNPRLIQIELELDELRRQYIKASSPYKKIIHKKAILLIKEKTLILSKRLGQKKRNIQFSIIPGWEK